VVAVVAEVVVIPAVIAVTVMAVEVVTPAVTAVVVEEETLDEL
jgi:hypothetical protein